MEESKHRWPASPPFKPLVADGDQMSAPHTERLDLKMESEDLNRFSEEIDKEHA